MFPLGFMLFVLMEQVLQREIMNNENVGIGIK